MIAFVNTLISALGAVAVTIVNLLPASPFLQILEYASPLQPYLKYIAWFIPVTWIISTMTAWLTALLTYYLYRVILRFTKVIS